MATRSVIVAGRKPALLRSLKRLLEPEFEVAGMSDNVISLLDALEQLRPDLLVLDTGSAEFAGADLPLRLELKHPALHIVVVGSADVPPGQEHPHIAHIRKYEADESLLPAARRLLAQNGAGNSAGS